MEKLRDKRFVVCPRCEGKGWIEVPTGDRERVKMSGCPLCGGDRLLERIVVVELRRIDDGRANEEKGASLEEEEFWG